MHLEFTTSRHLASTSNDGLNHHCTCPIPQAPLTYLPVSAIAPSWSFSAEWPWPWQAVKSDADFLLCKSSKGLPVLS
jgi:hypothetical protein